jgi:hypothetical protein
MTFEEYATVIESKVQGAWNFHNALKAQSLDFFAAISSAAAAVGNRGQAAYAAANVFLNAFVQFRLKQGLPASSIDLTAVSDSGYLAENAEAAAEVMRNLGSDTICEAEVLALLGAAISGHLATACNNHRYAHHAHATILDPGCEVQASASRGRSSCCRKLCWPRRSNLI